MRQSKPVRLETAPTPINRDRNRPAPIISLQVYPEHRGFIGGIETEGRKCVFVFSIHHNCVPFYFLFIGEADVTDNPEFTFLGKFSFSSLFIGETDVTSEKRVVVRNHLSFSRPLIGEADVTDNPEFTFLGKFSFSSLFIG